MLNAGELDGRSRRSTTSDRTFQVLYEVAVAASGVLEPERLADLAVHRARQLTGADASSLFWWVPERELLIPLAHDPVGSAANAHPLPPGEDAIGLAFQCGEAQLVQDYARWRHAVPAIVQLGVKSVLAVPLSVRGQAAGVLSVRSFEQARWRDRQLEVLSLLATLVAPALEAARRHADLAASEESFRAVFDDAQDHLHALVREFSVHRTEPMPDGEPISMSEAQALMELRAGDELSQTALAVRLRLEKSTVSRLAAQMETRGWLARNRDAADARLMRLRLTPRGRALASDLAAVRTSKLQGILTAIPESERESVLQALKIVVRALHHGPIPGEAPADEAG